MKRAKIMLTAVGLLAVVGGALAYKAARVPQALYTTNALGQCKVTFFTSLTTVPQFVGQQPITTTNRYSTATTNAACPTLTLYTIE
jgi:hypothetical protein